MCGIAGIINLKNQGINQDHLKGMTECLTHRGPDDSGCFSDEHVGFGFRRLSIIDLTTGHQPMANEDETLWVIFNGEIYNFPELKEELSAKGHSFRTTSDTEVILKSYMQWGIECVSRFNGMFAFAIYDRKKQKVFLVRDRLGIKPLHYAFVDDRLLFGSEMKAILAHPQFERRANHQALSSYLTFRYPQGDQPVFDGMKRLLPGHWMEISAGQTTIKKYWEIPFFAKKEDRGEKYYLKEIDRLLTAAVKRRMISDVPLGALLSGGLDSSIVVALMSKLTNSSVKTFSIGFDQQGYDESPYAKLVSDACKVDHHSLILSQENYMSSLKQMIAQKDAPLSIPHEVALNRICVELKKYITVVISGEGADELFGGYGRVQRSPMDYKKICFVNKAVPEPMRRLTMKMMGANGKADEWLTVKSHMDHFFSVYNWMPFDEKKDIFTDQMRGFTQDDQPLIDFWQRDFDYVQGGDPYDRILYMFEKNHLICLLDRLDSMSMAASVEARVPFVDHELVEFVSSIPHHYKMKWRSPLHRLQAIFKNSFQASERLDQSKHILREYARGLIPKEIVERKKLGFPVPLDAWIKDGMVEQAREILLDPKAKARGIFEPAKIEQLLENQQHLDYDFWGKKIWMLMNIELWFDQFIDQPAKVKV